jgi:hypothetical protein
MPLLCVGSISMANYRLFFIGPDDHIVRAQIVTCTTDSDAIAAARARCTGHSAIEVWDGARKVERVCGDVRMEDQAARITPSGPAPRSGMSGGMPTTVRPACSGVRSEAHLVTTAESHDVVGDWLQTLANSNG